MIRIAPTDRRAMQDREDRRVVALAEDSDVLRTLADLVLAQDRLDDARRAYEAASFDYGREVDRVLASIG